MDYLLGLSDVDRHLNTAYSDLGLNDKTIDRIADDLRILHSENKKDTQVVSDDTGGLSILIELIQKLKDFKEHHRK